ncbi:exodeoxyribonuclease V subunit gamma [Pseudomarimonas arenosa]|uniref:RecBCD enzyme subunit RecC n=1 Tax=Pseudomarimonas arenosa TaxID=2774145 RepID=A0AAW3ZG02_9GAMM|nr:exodeoxyribonuclease V subunit gamma [Pseudomarimonas arenosa]MBD8524259.1 exodeoxyribonuclease V subunit gamma [Pseudomarimonas arenosa]
MSQESAAELPLRGLLVYRASRLEALLEPLAALLRACPPTALLAPAELICAHPGMRRWLLNQLAQQDGPRGIAANLRIDLPGQWVERMARQHGRGLDLPAPAGPLLRWRVFDLLGEGAALTGSPSFARYLLDDPAGRRRWQLSQALADIFGRLLVYRPDWLRSWQRGQSAVDRDADLAALWRQLRQRWPEPLRIDQQEQIRQGLFNTAIEPTPLHVFGLAHLPPSTLDLLRAAAQQRPVVLYFPDPCREHWVGLRDDRQRLRQLISSGVNAQTELLYLGTEHPLLASLGRLGQHFSALLAGADSEVLLDVRHWQDERPEHAAVSLLHQVQASIRELDVAQIQPPPGAGDALLAQDASLRIHRCHSRLRELEVLRDALLQALNDLPDLQPSDIAVLSPTMQAYAPLLPAVFGAAADPTSRLPYHVADLPQSADHPLFATYLSLLGMPLRRMTCGELLALLDLDMLRRGLGMDEVGRQQLEHWLRSASVAWGLDSESRQQHQLPDDPTHSFAWGMDRLLGGHLLGEDAAEAGLIDGVLAVDALALGDSPALGGLYRLLGELHTLRRWAETLQPASRWSIHLAHLVNTLFSAKLDDERQALTQLQACLGRLEQQRAASGLDPELSHAQVLSWVSDALAEVPENTPFLHGGISFCGMVPQRALPFQVIAVLGLNEADYPRREAAEQHDPMRLAPRPGDRSVLIDDRYLFLETLMSARSRLHLSYVGEQPASGKPVNPSAPLFELDRLLQQRLPMRAEGGQLLRPWWIDHPLQPFDPRYFVDSPHPGLFTYHAGFAARPLAANVDGRVDACTTGDTDRQASVSVKHLLRWLRDPAAELLRDRHQVRLDGVDVDQLPEHEPLDRESARGQPLWRHLLEQALRNASPPPEHPDPLLLASGWLPAAELGASIYRAEQHKALDLWQHTELNTPLCRASQGQWHALEVQDKAHGLEGRLDRVWLGPDSAWLIDWQLQRKKTDRWSVRLPLLTRWLLVSLHPDLQSRRLQCALIDERGLYPMAMQLNAVAAQADFQSCAARECRMAALRQLLDLYRQAEHQPLAYFPRLSAAVQQGKGEEATWLGNSFQPGERDHAPGYTRLLSGEAQLWLRGHPAAEQLRAVAERLAAMLELSFLRPASPR